MTDGYAGQHQPENSTSDFNTMDFIVRAIAGQMQTMTAAIVKAVDAVKLTVDVQPLVNQIDGDGNATPHGVIHGLPYWRLQGGNGAVILTPAVGDIGPVIFAREDISSVKKNKAPSNPGSRRTYSYSDGIYLGGVLNGTPSTYVQIDTGGTVKIVAPTSVTITTPTATFSGDVAVTGHVTTGVGSIFGGRMFDTHIHSGVQAGTANTGGPV